MLANAAMNKLGNITVETFLAEYWQRKPVFIPGALRNYRDSLSAEKLFALSSQAGVESRLVIETPAEDELNSTWQLEYGPLSSERFKTLPKSHWSLLVNSVDHLEPELHQFMHRFRFMPNWRLDDVMVSYASESGSIGPHFDYYDVFLFQAAGERRWRIGQQCNVSSSLRDDTEMKILDNFIQQDEFLCKPGDLLYIPPKVAHWGIANKESITYSVGFFAPSHSDIILEMTQELGSNISNDSRFSDPYRRASLTPGEITREDLIQIKDIIRKYLDNEDNLAQYFGEMITTSQRSNSENSLQISELGPWVLAAHVRSSYYLTSQETCLLFIDGLSWDCPYDLAKTICHYRPLRQPDFANCDKGLVEFLFSEGKLRDE